MGTDPRKLRLLLIDDNDDDRRLSATALQDTGLTVDLFEATDGYAGLGYIYGDREYADREKFPFPDIVFLDIKMPGMDGFAVLRQIRSNPKTKRLPVIMLSNSDLPSDLQAAYALGADAFHRKPVSYRALVDLLRSVLTPWLDIYSARSHFKRKEF